MDLPALLTDLTGLGTLISGIAAVIAAVKATKTARQFQPNHGSSMREILRSLQREVAGLGHQVGEIRREMDRDHRDYNERLHDLEHRNK